MDFLKDARELVRESVPECRNFGIKTKMAVGIHASMFASLKSKH